MNKILYVIDSNIRNYLKKTNTLEPTEYISIEELEEKLTFSFSKQTIVRVSNHFNLSIETTRIYLSTLRYIYSSNIKSNKLDIIFKIKDYCLKNNLLHFYNYKEKIKNYDIILKTKISPFLRNLLPSENIKEEIDSYVIKDNNVYCFDTIDDELLYVGEKISSLLRKGENINRIKIVNKCKDYTYRLHLYLNLFNIPFNYKSDITLYSLKFIKDLLKKFENDTIENVINTIKNKDLNLDERKLLQSLINILNNYSFSSSYKEIKNSLIYDLKHSYKANNVLDNAVEITSDVMEGDIIFIIGFNLENYPSISKDEDFLNDNEKKVLGIFTSIDKNKIEREHINKILSFDNVYLSYSSISYKSKFNPSSYVKDYNFKEIQDYVFTYDYSNKVNKFKYAYMLDNLDKYRSNLEKLYATYDKIDYKNYNNKFKGIDKFKLYEYLNNYLPLSYSSLDNYYNCSFKYYLSSILKIDIYEDNFSTFIGSLYHYVLSFMFDDDFSFDNRWNEFLNKRELTNKEKVLLDKFKKGLMFIIENINKQNELINYDKYLLEQEAVYYIDGPLRIRFKGLIDKILYKDSIDEEGNSIRYAVLIDYKTFIPSLSVENIDYGLNLQLPIYIHLLRKIKGFENAKVYGFYLQSIIFDDTLKHDNKKSIEEINRNNMKLKGYSVNPIYKNGEFDSTRPDSLIIDKLKVNKDGSYSKNSLILSEEEINFIETISSNKINEAIENIKEARFDINPKYIDNKLVGCQFCKFKDICYKKFEDTNYLDESLKILRKGGDDDVMDE